MPEGKQPPIDVVVVNRNQDPINLAWDYAYITRKPELLQSAKVQLVGGSEEPSIDLGDAGQNAAQAFWTTLNKLPTMGWIVENYWVDPGGKLFWIVAKRPR